MFSSFGGRGGVFGGGVLHFGIFKVKNVFLAFWYRGGRFSRCFITFIGFFSYVVREPFLSPFLFFEVMINFFSDESEEKGKRWGFWYHGGLFLFFTWSLFEVMQSEEVKNRERSDESEESGKK
jgi:hypothetical protein